MKPRILIDLDVFTKAVWDRKKEARDFLETAEKEFVVITPVIVLFYIIRNWRYKKLVDKIFGQIDKITAVYLGHTQTNLKSIRVTGLPLKVLTRKISRGLGIPIEDARIVIYSALNGAKYLVSFNRKHLKDKEREIKEFLPRYNLDPLQIILPPESSGN